MIFGASMIVVSAQKTSAEWPSPSISHFSFFSQNTFSHSSDSWRGPLIWGGFEGWGGSSPVVTILFWLFCGMWICHKWCFVIFSYHIAICLFSLILFEWYVSICSLSSFDFGVHTIIIISKCHQLADFWDLPISVLYNISIQTESRFC